MDNMVIIDAPTNIAIDPIILLINFPISKPKKVKKKLNIENIKEVIIIWLTDISYVKPTPKLSKLTPKAKIKVPIIFMLNSISSPVLYSLNICIAIYRKIIPDKNSGLMLNFSIKLAPIIEPKSGIKK